MLQGDAVRFNTNTKDDYKNGDEALLVRVSEKHDSERQSKQCAKLSLSNGTTIACQNHFDPAYAGTVHKAQGSEYSTVILPFTHPINWYASLCTSLTRARQRIHIVGKIPEYEILPVSRRTVFPFIHL